MTNFTEMNDITIRNKAFVTVKLCLIAIALLAGFLFYFTFYKNFPTLEHITSYQSFCLYAFLLISLLWLLKKNITERDINISTIIDLLFVTTGVYLTGCAVSPLLVLYLPVLIGYVLISSRRAGFVAGAFILVLYSTLLLLIFNHIVPYSKETISIPRGGFIFQYIGLISAILLVIIGTNFLRKTLYASALLAAKHEHDLIQLNTSQETLLEGIPDGVIFTDANDTITKINQTACELFRTTKELARKHNFFKILEEVNPQLKEIELKEGVHEFVLREEDGNAVTLRYSLQVMRNSKSEVAGKLYVFQDMTKLYSAEELLALQEKMACLLSERHENNVKIQHPKLGNLVGESQVMQEVFKLISLVASSEANVLINGESGTGKELVAKAIHLNGNRANEPFVALNCGAVPENLIESELFGHKKGSFTGAESDHIGMFQQANKGTLFLDEIGELPLALQAKLLRAIQEKTIRMVGAEQEKTVDVRIISATNRDLQEEVKTGRFRQDLYYRLNVINVKLPALRERKEDLPLLVNSILSKLVPDKKLPSVSPATMKCLLRYNYPGNVRELENALERALVLANDIILPQHLPTNIREYEGSEVSSKKENVANETTTTTQDDNLKLPVQLDDILDSLERRYVEEALKQSNGSRSRAASLLGINLRSLRYRIQKYM